MKKTDLLKAGVDIVVTIGIGAIVGNAITATTPVDIRGLKKLSVVLGGIVLTGIACDMASEYVEKRFDDSVERFKKIFKKNEENMEESNETCGPVIRDDGHLEIDAME